MGGMLLLHTVHGAVLNNSFEYAKRTKQSITEMSYERRVLSLNCTVCAFRGEGTMIIVCSALDVPGTNSGSFVSVLA